MSLALKLREGTSQNHNEAESAGFIRCFMKGILEKLTYTSHLESFYFVYQTLEEELNRHKTHPIVSKIYFPELYRTSQIEKDLNFFLGNDWKSKIKITSATQNYVNNIKNISNNSPELLIAHSYVRYLGDLSGGQILKKVAARALQLDGAGLDFYEFPEIPSPNEFKKVYRETLDSLDLSEDQQNQIVLESRKVFDLNKEIFLELEDDLIRNIGREKYDSVQKAS
ncbi:biliverdin-producing heme oxygenase [Leptospira sp. GIMC2001]|uniref:biliverdin-producing heme oxygenase n=1 Tax=Leptospira sp. GIMC2001 TaxID=1513297 RepID=UPI00234AB00F|nr:biliverdin-producing heme oxygenase [Leptospira sp. GIMC2001]WCL49237.1 biliverdin-producing heme oxygenase [Leptospira sp. GIMC2001]